MDLPLTFTISLLKSEMLILAVLPPYAWLHQLEIRHELRNARDLDLEELGHLLHGLWRFGLLLERPHSIMSEFMLSERGIQIRNQLAQRHLGLTVVQTAEPA